MVTGWMHGPGVPTGRTGGMADVLAVGLTLAFVLAMLGLVHLWARASGAVRSAPATTTAPAGGTPRRSVRTARP